MHDKVTRILRSYPFSFTRYYRDYAYGAIADSIHELRRTPQQFFELSEGIRKLRDNTPTEKVSEFLHLEFLTERQQINLLGLMSFSSNGYLRQASLMALQRFETPYILPYVILRLQDWVAPVREMAQTMLATYAALAKPENWEFCALLINRISERTYGREILKLIHNHFRQSFGPDLRAGWFLAGHKEMRRLLWGLFSDQDLEKVATPSFITSESDPKLAGEVFQRLIRILPRGMVLDAGIKHSSNRIRYSALQALSELGGTELKDITQTALSDKSSNVRDLARFIYRSRFDLVPKDYFIDFDVPPDDTDAKLGYVLGWLESAQDDADKFLEFYKHSPRGKIRGAALMAYARVAGYSDEAPGLIMDALENGSHARDVAAKLIKMGWASGIAEELWALADRETEPPRQMRLYRLAAQSDWQNALLPALRRTPDALPVILIFLLDIIEKWSRLSRIPDLSEDEKVEGRALVKTLNVGRHKKDWLNFLFI